MDHVKHLSKMHTVFPFYFLSSMPMLLLYTPTDTVMFNGPDPARPSLASNQDFVSQCHCPIHPMQTTRCNVVQIRDSEVKPSYAGMMLLRVAYATWRGGVLCKLPAPTLLLPRTNIHAEGRSRESSSFVTLLVSRW